MTRSVYELSMNQAGSKSVNLSFYILGTESWLPFVNQRVSLLFYISVNDSVICFELGFQSYIRHESVFHSLYQSVFHSIYISVNESIFHLYISQRIGHSLKKISQSIGLLEVTYDSSELMTRGTGVSYWPTTDLNTFDLSELPREKKSFVFF